MKDKFFTKLDWASFWTATTITFAVYFFTLGPSVGLEDSGELATAAAHLGVPHPPGYPFWTLCSWVFCKLFSWVTYMGYPTPAWAVSLCSAVFGAFAAGFTAMLICRSGRDFIRGKNDNYDCVCGKGYDFDSECLKDAGRISRPFSSFSAPLCFGGGVGGALTFAFSPAEWSQSTIVEVYSLNAFFLMWVFLLSYRWMKKPSDKILWLTAFVFGLGLTNYQVLLFAIVPLAVMISLKDVRLFRDFSLYLIPVLLSVQVLQVGDLGRAQYGMSTDAIGKQPPVGIQQSRYAVFGSNLLGEYISAAVNPEYGKRSTEEFQRQLRECDNAKDMTEEQRRQTRKQIEAALKTVRTVDSSISRLDGATRDKLWQMGVARHFIGMHQSPEGVRLSRDLSGFLSRLGFSRSDLQLKDGKQVFTDDALATLHRMAAPPALKSSTERNPNVYAVILSLVVFVGALLAGLFFKKRGDADLAVKTVLAGGAGGTLLLVLSVTLFASSETWAELSFAPLADPIVYVMVGAFTLASAACAVSAAFCDERAEMRNRSRMLLTGSAVFALMAVISVYCVVPSSEGLASMFGYFGDEYPWHKSVFAFWILIFVLFGLSATMKKGLCFAIPVAGFHAALFLLLSRGAMNGLTHPVTWWFWWPLAWNIVVLALAWCILPNGRAVAGSAFFAQLGVAFYAYMPIVSDLRNPPMNWGYPRTWEGFKHAITRGQYEEIKMPEFTGIEAFWDLIKVQLSHYFLELKIQFSDFLVLLALVPLTCWRFTVKSAKRCFSLNGLKLCLVLLAVLAARALSAMFNIGTAGWMQTLDRILIGAMAVIAGFGVAVIAFKQLLMRPGAAVRRHVGVAWREKRHSRLAVFAMLPVGALLVSVYYWAKPDGSSMLFLLTVVGLAVFANAVYFGRFVSWLKRRPDGTAVSVSFMTGNLSQQWLLASGACFFMMTLPLILLANVKGDIQDGFIQKVKFISSHAMVALWIGYGLVLIGTAVCSAAAGRRGGGAFRCKVLAAVLAAAMILGAGITPIVKNYVDDELVFMFGGSEQNGHTFGWQFGAYQLEGAAAIKEQLVADEEPLPDPDYPPAMEKSAIFFGGTDPGRFVPTYMIYAANFRPDVYLITQNALADDTYMSVERDLYGDEIWIPSKVDSAEAFNIYVDEVQRGVRQANGDLKIENGSVQVTGELGVMEINGILTRMMFDHDRERRAFYIEESYVIPWMYPYLSPHGLIMKINKDEKPYDAKLAVKDRDFWDWYTRRLLDDPMYRRDFAGQKSFSKLRAAIAGLYTRQGRYRESAQAFREACLLYPASPEATFRYLQECLIPMRRWNVVFELLVYTDKIDPKNRRTKSLRDPLMKMIAADKEARALEEKRRSGKLPVRDAVKLADIYIQSGRARDSAQVVREVADDMTDVESLGFAWQVLLAARFDSDAEKVLVRYVKLNPGDYHAWAELAKLQNRAGRREEAVQSFITGCRVNQQAMLQKIQQDRELYEIAAPMLQRRK